ncbi:MAG: agmatine deiminase family protein [Rhodanobacteraceae bacterium]
MTEVPMRWPAEWEPQAGVLVAWPHAGTDWAANLAEVEQTYLALAAAVTRFQPLLVCVPDAALRSHVERLLEHGTGPFPVRLLESPYDDTWLRDSGPITLRDDAGKPELADFRFTGWGGKHDAAEDNLLSSRLASAGAFADTPLRTIDWALEGGAIESDGQGSVLTTWHCMHARHPDLTREQIARHLADYLHADRVLWLDNGALQGDDTDAHIDTLARFAPGNRIVYQACDAPEDPHHDDLARMAEELAALRTGTGKPYTLIALPWPRAIVEDGRRLAASYANYLVINDAVLVPAYADPADTQAAMLIGQAHPGREIIPIPCRPLISQNGSLHCITMQLPVGVLG